MHYINRILQPFTYGRTLSLLVDGSFRSFAIDLFFRLRCRNQVEINYMNQQRRAELRDRPNPYLYGRSDHPLEKTIPFAPDFTICNVDQPITHPHRAQLPGPGKYYFCISELPYRDTRSSSGDFPFLGRITSMVSRGGGYRGRSLRSQHQRLT